MQRDHKLSSTRYVHEDDHKMKHPQMHNQTFCSFTANCTKTTVIFKSLYYLNTACLTVLAKMEKIAIVRDKFISLYVLVLRLKYSNSKTCKRSEQILSRNFYSLCRNFTNTNLFVVDWDERIIFINLSNCLRFS